MSRLQNIIFDLGGVLINLDFSKTTNAFHELGFPHFEEMFSQHKADQLFRKLEKGEISNSDFYEVMLKVGNDSITEVQIRHAWNSLLLDFRAESIGFLTQLKKEYKIYLLSNTNSIHLDAFNEILEKQMGLPSLDGLFTKAYYSHQIGLRKPDAEIFEFVLKDAGITATETLFIDDTSENTTAAAAAGIRSHLLLPGERIEQLAYFRDYLISSNSI